VAEDLVEECTVPKGNGQSYRGYRLSADAELDRADPDDEDES